jgi:predicted ATPase with chaperone activity
VRAGYDPFLTGHRVVLSGGRGWTYHLAVGGPIAWPLTLASSEVSVAHRGVLFLDDVPKIAITPIVHRYDAER